VKAGDPAKRRKSTMADETENQTAESQPHQMPLREPPMRRQK